MDLRDYIIKLLSLSGYSGDAAEYADKTVLIYCGKMLVGIVKGLDQEKRVRINELTNGMTEVKDILGVLKVELKQEDLEAEFGRVVVADMPVLVQSLKDTVDDQRKKDIDAFVTSSPQFFDLPK